MSKIPAWSLLCFLLLLSALMSVQIDTSLSLSSQWQLLWQPQKAHAFADVFFVYAQLPRLVMTLLVGATLGLVGSLMQQLTQNPLTSPLTMGTSSGAWLALVVINIWFVDWVADYSALAAMVGALAAFALIIIIAGMRNLTGLPLVISGMVINILLGSLATALIILNAQFAQNVFMWGAGDLAQYGWDWVQWLWPRLLPALLLLLLAPRILTLMRLGHEGAAARGLSVLPSFFLLLVVGIWLVSASITAVGVISFIGLLTPNIARYLGARTAKQELYCSLLLGAILLLLTDSLSMLLAMWSEQVIPSGVTAAAIGAPALLWFSRRKLSAQDQMPLSFASQRRQLTPATKLLSAVILLLGIALYSLLSYQQGSLSWGLPGEYQWQLRWPRMATALCVGVALAIAGTLLQRVIHNPLASPDILGVSAGATFALVVLSLYFGSTLLIADWQVAFAGSAAVLLILLLLGKRHQFSPPSIILIGIALTALLQALVQFALAKGSGDSYKILLWLAGSTYRVSAAQASALILGVALLSSLALALSRWLTLMSIGRDFAAARGLKPMHAQVILLSLVALLCALSTATMGPVAFVGLIAPHMAMMLGARGSKQQMVLGGVIGAALMIWADWLGQIALYPNQIAAGTLVAILGGSYFLLLMSINRLR